MKKQKPYSISVRVDKTIYEAEGESMLQALEELPKPVKIFNKGIVTISNGDKSKEYVLLPIKLKRLWYKIATPYLAKNFEFLLK